MAYVRNEWKENDIITAEKLNNLEEGCNNTFDLGVIDVELPTEENPNFSIEGNLTDEQIEKLRKCNQVSISTAEGDENFSTISYLLIPITGKAIYDGFNGGTSFNNEIIILAGFIYNGDYLYNLQFNLISKSYNLSIKYSKLN